MTTDLLILKKEVWIELPSLVNFAMENKSMTLVFGICSKKLLQIRSLWQEVAASCGKELLLAVVRSYFRP